MEINRRKFIQYLSSCLASTGLVGTTFSHKTFATERETLKIGLNIPMTGDYAPWGLPGLYGCQIVADELNNHNGVRIGDKDYSLEIIAYDHGYDTEKALQGFKKLYHEDKVKMVMMLGGSTVSAVIPFANRKKVLTTTLLPSDLSKNTPYLVAPCETHPLYNVTGVQWLAQKFPEAKTVAICTTNDVEYGKQSAATYAAAFEVEGIQLLDTVFHGFDVVDFAPIVSGILAKKPDIFCMATDVYTTPIVEQLYHQGFKGKIISCTLDGYQDVIKKTSLAFAEGIVFQFPDFDDSKLTQETTNFPDPQGFSSRFNEKHPGEWSAVAWEYPSILLNWLEAAKKAKSTETEPVLASMLENKNSLHTFKNAQWWGKELWGRNHALVGDWPVVAINGNGKAVIQEFISVYDWLSKHQNVLIKHMKQAGL